MCSQPPGQTLEAGARVCPELWDAPGDPLPAGLRWRLPCGWMGGELCPDMTGEISFDPDILEFCGKLWSVLVLSTRVCAGLCPGDRREDEATAWLCFAGNLL